MEHNQQTIRCFEDHLRRHEKQLVHSMISTVAQGRATSNETQDVADQAVDSYQKELLFSQGTNGHEQLSLVRAALERLQEGTFGECLNCGRPIGLKRLEALPWTSYCIGCQEKVERGDLEDPDRAA